jgi:predicted dinucleotide-binding enzyme
MKRHGNLFEKIVDIENIKRAAFKARRGKSTRNNVRKFFTNADESLMEKLQELVPEAHFVKAFNYFDSKAMVNSAKSKAQIMNICGNEDAAKAEAKEILAQFGFKSKDMGKVEAAREIEQMAISI